MKWLEWATIDLENGLGGAEIHARCVAKELEKRGHEVVFSQDTIDLFRPDWDVIHTRGSALNLKAELELRIKNANVVRVQSLHGTTLGRMTACKEWTWPGGYLASTKELVGVQNADVVVADHASLWLYQLAEKQGKVVATTSNAWNAFDVLGLASLETGESAKLPEKLHEEISQLHSYWLYLGRGFDPVKAVERVREIARLDPGIHYVAAPGAGFEDDPHVLKTGSLLPGQLQSILKGASGLVLTSKYEGLPLVVMEALGEGIPVVTTNVGGIASLNPKLKGLKRIQFDSSKNLLQAIRDSNGEYSRAEDDRMERAKFNRQILPTWADIAQVIEDAVSLYMTNRR